MVQTPIHERHRSPQPHGGGSGERPERLVVVPVFNEERSVEQVLREVKRHAAGADVLVIDDGSTDATPRILRAMDGVAVLRHPFNRGYGAALLAGFRYARQRGYQYLVTIDCDGQHEPALIPTFFATLDGGWDVVSGSRYLSEAAADGTVPPDRLAINREFTGRLNRLTGYGITDAFCGFKGYRVAALSALHLDEPGYGFPLQVWAEAWRHGLSVVELPVPRIYKSNFERRFGGELDRPEVRRRYYERVLRRALLCPLCAAQSKPLAGSQPSLA